MMDQLGLFDKSLVVAEDVSGLMRYRLLETGASMRWRDSASPAKPTLSATATVITTATWPLHSFHRCAAAMSG